MKGIECVTAWGSFFGFLQYVMRMIGKKLVVANKTQFCSASFVDSLLHDKFLANHLSSDKHKDWIHAMEDINKVIVQENNRVILLSKLHWPKKDDASSKLFFQKHKHSKELIYVIINENMLDFSRSIINNPKDNSS